VSSGIVFPGLQFSKSAAWRHYSRYHAVEPTFLVVGDTMWQDEGEIRRLRG